MPYLQQIWANKILTNSGPFHEQLEEEISKYLDVKHISLFTNGTVALLTALKAFNISGEVITSPYSFVATSHSLLWNGVRPVFVDIDPSSLNIDPLKIEAAITPRTSAILAVHCYGTPCDVENIQRIADVHGLKVIYDSAHAFGVKNNFGSILDYGNLSVLSFHATKVFNTFEGGAIVSSDKKTKLRIDQLRNFGIVDETSVLLPGINGKMSEFNAALGLLQLKYIDQAIENRKAIDCYYRNKLRQCTGIRMLEKTNNVISNYSYFPIMIDPEYPLSRDALYEKLKMHDIHPRRYFYPLISDFPMYKDFPSANCNNLAFAKQAASRILCLPIYPDLCFETVDKICRLITFSVV